MSPPIIHDTFFPYVHLSLEKISIDDIHSIADWIAQLTQAQDHFQIDMDASHPWLSSILSTLLLCIIDNEYLSYIHIKQSHPRHFLTPDLLQDLIQVVRTNRKNSNITVQVTYRDKVEYH